MKNLDINNLTKVELINEIINLTNKCNECIRLRGYLNTHKILSASTLRTKNREFLEKQFARHLGDDFLHMSTLLFVHSLFLFINHSSYTLSCTHWAHCCKERERSNVVWGMGLPNFTI